jgi:hypothetical protein
MAVYCYTFLYDWCYLHALLTPAINLQRGEPPLVDRTDNLFFKVVRCSLLPKAANTSYHGDQWAVNLQCEYLDRTELALCIFILFIPLCHWFMALYKLTVVGLAIDKEVYRLMLCDTVSFCETSSTLQRDFGKFLQFRTASHSKELRHQHYEISTSVTVMELRSQHQELRNRLWMT